MAMYCGKTPWDDGIEAGVCCEEILSSCKVKPAEEIKEALIKCLDTDPEMRINVNTLCRAFIDLYESSSLGGHKYEKVYLQNDDNKSDDCDEVSQTAVFEAKKIPHTSARDKYQNGEYFWNVDIIYEGIEKGQRISFLYNTYYVDKKNKIQRKPITDESGEPKRFIVDPYRMAMTNGRYFLIGREKDSAIIDNFQIDRITDIKLLDTGFERVEDIEKSFNLSEYVSQHIYMFSGSIERVVFRANKIILGDVVDWFGNDLTVMQSDGDSFTASVKVNYKAMKYWAIQYLKYVTVLSPKGLVDDIKSTISGALDNYNKENL
ncbi:MAG: WYL domain-containing protein [Oscillospiraceae bacterium]